MLIGRLLVSLAAVLGLMWVIARRVKRTGPARGTTLVDVLGRRQLSRTASVAVVRVGERALVLGVTDAQVTLIGETDLAGAEQAVAETGRRPAPRPPDLTNRIGPDGRILAQPPAPRNTALAGSALSPDTWRQAVSSLRGIRHK